MLDIYYFVYEFYRIRSSLYVFKLHCKWKKSILEQKLSMHTLFLEIAVFWTPIVSLNFLINAFLIKKRVFVVEAAKYKSMFTNFHSTTQQASSLYRKYNLH